MARPPRIQYPGAWHHVMNRGAARQDIFRDQRDRRRFLRLLTESVSRFGVEVHCYCLMGNHYHLLVRTPEPNLDAVVQHYASHYVRGFNARHGRDGPLFRARYRSILVESNSYVVAVSRYIHRNPLDLGVSDLVNYEWSSLGAYVGTRRRPKWLTTRAILEEFGDRRSYHHLVTGPYVSEIETIYRGAKLPAVVGRDTTIADVDPPAAV